VSQDEPKKTDLNGTNLSGDELDQVRELLFGGTIREIERQREALQKDVNVSFAEADQMTNRRLDDVMRRLDGLHQELARDRDDRKNNVSAENQRIDSTLVRLASEQASTLAQESQRIDQHIAAETARIDQHIEAENTRIDEAIKRETARVSELIKAETARIDEALAKESARIDEALDALHRQIESDKLQQAEALRRSVAAERNRLSQNMRLLAESVMKDQDE